MMRGDGDIGFHGLCTGCQKRGMFSLAGPCGWKLTGILRVHRFTFNFDNGSGTYTYHGKIAGSFVSADTYLVIPEEVYRSVNPKRDILWIPVGGLVLKKNVASVEQSLNDLLSDTSHIKLNTYHAELQTAEYASRMMKLGCYLFMAICRSHWVYESGKHHDHQYHHEEAGIRCAAKR